MAGSVIWSIPALKELRSIKRYLTKNASPEAATRVTKQITIATRRLEDFPDSGRMVPGPNRPEIKELLVSGYRVIYLRSFDATEVLHIAHQRQDLRGKRFRDLWA